MRKLVLLGLVVFALSVLGCSRSDSRGAGGLGDTSSARIAVPDPNDDDDEQPPPNKEPVENDFVATATNNTSTFAVDVDTGSYSLARRALVEGKHPDPKTIRPEEFLNYFHYAYPEPTSAHPFSVNVDGSPSTFGEGLHLLRVGLQGKHLAAAERQAANLVFLIDVSGSMQSSDKLGLVQYALKELVNRLGENDTIGIVVYAGADAVLLSPTPVFQKSKILDAIEGLTAGGSTNGEAGIKRAYTLAEAAKREGGINRVILCTDGDFNVGLTGDALISLIEEKRDSGVFLTTLGFGTGNYQDGTLEQLADHGNGNYAYIDNRGEAVRVLGDKLVSTLQVIGKDVKVQVEFDANVVRRYRLIGYENRFLENEDFRNDSKDAGELGAGHAVTALYEVELSGAEGTAAVVRFRYKLPDGDTATEFETAIAKTALLAEASTELKWAAAVAEFAEILRLSKHSSGARFAEVLGLLAPAAEATPSTDRDELIELVKQAQKIWK